MYKSYSCASASEGTPYSIMCQVSTTPTEIIETGDKNGIRFLYPKNNSFSLGTTGTKSGSDIAIMNINSGTAPDLALVWGDYTSPSTTINAKIIWDISSTTSSGTVGSVVSLGTVTGQINDLGATLYNADTDAIPDLIITYNIPNGASTLTYYKIYWDIVKSSTGTSFTYGGTAGPYSVIGSDGDKGTDITFFDINGNGSNEIVVMDTFPSGTQYALHYYYGTLSTSGTVSSWTTGSSSGTITVNSEDIGLSISYPSQRIGNVNYYPVSNSYIKEKIIHFTTTGGIDTGTNDVPIKFTPLKTSSIPTGVGGGDAINLGGASTNESFFAWTDTTNGYYAIDWDSKHNSHG